MAATSLTSSGVVSPLQYCCKSCCNLLESISVDLCHFFPYRVSCSEEVYLHLVHIQFHDIADLTVAVALHIAQVYHLALFFRKSGDDLRYSGHAFLCLGRFMRRWRRMHDGESLL